MNWRGRPLESHEVLIETISAVTTKSGLRVRAMLDTVTTTRGIKISYRDMAEFEDRHLARHDFHGDWNYAMCATRRPVVSPTPVSYTHLRAHETPEHLVCRLLLE